MVHFEASPGLLVVFAELGEKVTEHDFHDWYDNEHIPLRTSTLPTFTTAARFISTEQNEEPKWAAVYTISDNTIFAKPEYTGLREKRSPREAALVGRLATLDRRIYKLTSSPTSSPSPTSPHPSLILFHALTPTPESSFSELTALLESAQHRFESLPGFIRSRRYETVEVVRSGLKVTEEGSQKQDVGSVYEVIEFSSPEILTSPEYLSLNEWYKDALTASTSYRSFRSFKLWKEYEPTAALKEMK